MQKKRYLALLFLFVIPSVYPLCEEIAAQGWVNSTENITAKDNRSFGIIVSSDTTRIIADLPTGNSLSIKSGECDIMDFYDICFSSVNVSYHSYEEDRDYYKAKVVIYDLPACINLSRTVDKTDLLMNEEANFEVSILNSGEREATNIRLTDKFPSPFGITAVSGCKVYGDEVVWEGSLGKLQEKRCSYTIKPIAKANYSSKLSLAYFNGKENKKAYSDSVYFNIPDHQLHITAKLSADIAKLGDKVTLSVKIQNNNSDHPIRVENFYIDIPIGLEILNVPLVLEREYNTFRWQKTLEPSGEAGSVIELKAKKEEYHKIKIHADYIINSIRNTIDEYLALNEPLFAIKEENAAAPVKENIIDDLDEDDITNESIGLANETGAGDTGTENITTASPEIETQDEEETIISEKEEKEPIIKSIYKKVFNNPIFVVTDIVLIALMVIIVIDIRKSGKRIKEK